MKAIQDFFETTNQLISVLETEPDRDRKIEMIESLLEKREQSMARIHPPFSESEQVLGKRVLKLNQKVSILLEKQKVDIQRDLKQLSVKKESTNKYVNPYQSLSTDGMFYDKKK